MGVRATITPIPKQTIGWNRALAEATAANSFGPACPVITVSTNCMERLSTPEMTTGNPMRSNTRLSSMIGVAFIRAKTRTQLMRKSAVCEKGEQNFLQEEKSKMKRPCGKSSQIQPPSLLRPEMVLRRNQELCLLPVRLVVTNLA